MKKPNILTLKMPRNDAKAKTVGDYLRRLLAKVWEEDEGFSGWRPFGNSGWKYEVYAALVKGGVVSGKLDADGYVESVDSDAADAIIQTAIARLK